MRTRWRISLVAAVAGAACSLAAPAAPAALGDLAQKPGAAGCIAEAIPAVAGCTEGRTLAGASDSAVSPDGREVYVAASGSMYPPYTGGVAIFDRDEATGALTQRPGTRGCIAESGTGGCATAALRGHAGSLTVSPDGRNVYVSAGTTITIFDRDAATGDLTAKPGTAGCLSDDGSGGACIDAREIPAPGKVAISPDDTSAYVPSSTTMTTGAVAIFDRDPATGVLTQQAGPAGCISDDGSAGACADGAGLERPTTVALSPDSRSVYVASYFNGIATLDRDPATGALTQKAGADGCITIFGSDGCALGRGMLLPTELAVTADGSSVYLAAGAALALFDRDTTTGVLTQKAGTAGCISGDGSADGQPESEGACQAGRKLDYVAGVAASPDSASVYVAARAGESSSDGIAIFDRDTATGALTQKPGTAGCVSDDGSAGDCADGVGLEGIRQLTLAPDGTSLYAVAAPEGGGVLAAFDRSPGAGSPAAPTTPSEPTTSLPAPASTGEPAPAAPPAPPTAAPPAPPPPLRLRPQPRCALAGTVYEGTAAGDTRNGTAAIDVLFGGTGDDVLRGAGGRDCLYGEGGYDRLSGGDGDDLLSGGSGNDRLVDRAGRDVLSGAAGNDSIDARDVVAAGRAGADTVRCGAGRDVARVDRVDRVAGDCERVVRGGR